MIKEKMILPSACSVGCGAALGNYTGRETFGKNISFHKRSPAGRYYLYAIVRFVFVFTLKLMLKDVSVLCLCESV